MSSQDYSGEADRRESSRLLFCACADSTSLFSWLAMALLSSTCCSSVDSRTSFACSRFACSCLHTIHDWMIRGWYIHTHTHPAGTHTHAHTTHTPCWYTHTHTHKHTHTYTHTHTASNYKSMNHGPCTMHRELCTMNNEHRSRAAALPARACRERVLY